MAVKIIEAISLIFLERPRLVLLQIPQKPLFKKLHYRTLAGSLMELFWVKTYLFG